MKTFIGEFEQMVLLAVLQMEGDATALSVRRFLREVVGRRVSRGALYRTFDRLQEKGYLEWELREATPLRGGHARRLFQVSPAGRRVLGESRAALFRLWRGLEKDLGS